MVFGDCGGLKTMTLPIALHPAGIDTIDRNRCQFIYIRFIILIQILVSAKLCPLIYCGNNMQVKVLVILLMY